MLFEVKSIQTYLMASGRLRDIIGASELVDRMTRKADVDQAAPDSLLDAVLQSVDGAQSIQFARRAGGALYAFSQDGGALRRFARLWTLSVQHWAPGIGYALGWGCENSMLESFNAAREDLRQNASRTVPVFPIPAPVTARTPRTGKAAIARDRGREFVDAAGARSRRLADSDDAGFFLRYSPPEAHLGASDWPRDMDPAAAKDAEQGARTGNAAFPFVDEDRSIALVHGDANGMGQVLVALNQSVRKSPDEFLKQYQRFSDAIDQSTCIAARQATREVLLPARHTPQSALAARPILLGGDDVVVLVRADLALRYVQCFAEAFESQSATMLEHLDVPGIPPRLTISFGIAFVNASQPFSSAVRLAESLMTEAKHRAREHAPDGIAPSTVCFHRISGTVLDSEYRDIVEHELTLYESNGENRTSYIHTLGAYSLQADHLGLPTLDDLARLHSVLCSQNMARGPMRNLLNLLQLAPPQARRAWKRWRQLMGDRDPNALAKFDTGMERLVPSYDATSDVSGPYGRVDPRAPYRSPLGDVLTLMSTLREEPLLTTPSSAG